MEKYLSLNIEGKQFNAILTKNKPECQKGGEHSWDGEEIMTFHNDDRILKRSEFEKLPNKEQLNPASGECSCSKCGIGYMSYDNPYYSEI